MRFVADASTKVVGKGVGTKARAMKPEGKSPAITDLVDVFDNISVTYREMNGRLHAEEILINAKTARKKRTKMS
jgi:hypothetical protein